MLKLFFLFFCFYLYTNGENYGCDFESPCSLVTYDNYWNLASAGIPFEADAPDHDHTFENSSGHYIYFNLNSGSKYKESIISFDKIFNFTNQEEQKCLKFFYIMNADESINLNVRLSQGDLNELNSIWFTINSFHNKSSNWSKAEVNLPNDSFRIQIVLDLSNSNLSNILLTLDDIYVTNECEGNLTKNINLLYWCDFEQDDCNFENTMRLEWSRIKPNQSDDTLPKTDHTLNSTNGHYLRTSKTNDLNIAFLERIVSSVITIPDDSTPYCISFYFYSNTRTPFLNLFAIPLQNLTEDFTYLLNYNIWSNLGQKITNSWSWGIANLAPGFLKLAFVLTNNQDTDMNIALDDIRIYSCYSVNEPIDSYDLSLSSYFQLKCDFETDLCGFKNVSKWSRTDSLNQLFPSVGPKVDHTTGLTTGYFLNVDFSAPISSNFTALARSPLIFAHREICFEFYYYANSEQFNPVSKGNFSFNIGGCFSTMFLNFYPFKNYTQPQWTRVFAKSEYYACREFAEFTFSGVDFLEISFAVDDFRVDRCDRIEPTTTTTETSSTTTTTETSTTTTTTETSTTTTATITSTLTTRETSTKTSISTTVGTTISSSPPNSVDKNRLNYCLSIIILFSFFF